jgi:outer membrane protein assembly factor BamB
VAVITALAALVLILRWATAGMDPAYATVGTFAAIILGYVLLAVWALFAPWPFWLRWPLIVLPVVLVPVFLRVESLRFSGGMWPILAWRFGSDPDDVLDLHLAEAADRPVPAAVDLSGRGDGDWPEYRGRGRLGIHPGPELTGDWKTRTPKFLWKWPIGGGHSSFAIAGKALYTMEQRRGDEAITCYDADTGKQYWAFTYPTRFDGGNGDKGPRSTPTVDDGQVFAVGATGKLHCLDARTGKLRWGPVEILAGNENVKWGMTGSPLVLGNEVLVSAGVQSESAPNGTVVAYDRNTGKVLWSTSSRAHAGYSSPTVATLAGKRQLLLFDGDGLAGYELEDAATRGKELWRFPWKTNFQVNAAQPLVLDGDRVFISSGYGSGCALVQITHKDGTWKADRKWKRSTMQCKFSSPVYLQGRIFGLDNENLVSIDVETGKDRTVGKDYDFGQVQVCKDALLVTQEWGKFALVDPASDQLKEYWSVDALATRSWNVPALAHGRIYWRNHQEMVCYDLSGR